MPKYIAFLRAINVGGHTVKMDYLRELFADLGFTGVETFIASGNVIFDSPSRSPKALARKVEDSLRLTLGYAVATFIRTPAELAVIADYKPFPNADLGDTLYVGFMSVNPGEAATQKLLSSATKVDDFQVNGCEVYWLCRTKFSDSQFSGARLEKTLGVPVTLRNATTVKKLAAKYS